MSGISYRYIAFDKLIAEYKDLKVFRPTQLHSGPGWYYLGPTLISPRNPRQGGILVKANEPDSLDEVVDWQPVFIDIEGRKFSIWRGVPRNPDEYTVIGHFFVNGIEKPTLEQTEYIRAIRNDLISEQRADHLVWQERLPKASVTLWNKKTVDDRLHVPTGAFVSINGDFSIGIPIGLLRFGAVRQPW